MGGGRRTDVIYGGTGKDNISGCKGQRLAYGEPRIDYIIDVESDSSSGESPVYLIWEATPPLAAVAQASSKPHAGHRVAMVDADPRSYPSALNLAMATGVSSGNR